ncbi:unnamed protein product [Schistosoma margrebowiei]|uniref:Uncharacterized protein n=1 Tax=Schistosoma margrebowiei TaxID=48269 RepID=A0AA84ZE35_9TREM|nr:unnamed protein product [Schistosoma margrebowiei]
MKLSIIGIICIFSLLISQEYGYTIDVNMSDLKQKQYVRAKLDSLNQYLQSRGINKQFTEDEFYKIIYDRLNNHIENEKGDVRIIEKDVPKRPVPNINDNQPIQKPIDNETSDEFHSISDIFFFNKPWVPLWIVNPLYYMTEKFMQIMAFLLEDDNIREVQMPTYYYDTSI